IGGGRRGGGIGAGLDQRQRPLDGTVAGRRQQGLGLLGRAGGALLFIQRQRCRTTRGVRIPRRRRQRAAFAAPPARQGTQGAMADDQAAQRQHHHAINGQRGDSQLRRQDAVQAGERDRHERHHQQRQRRRQE